MSTSEVEQTKEEILGTEAAQWLQFAEMTANKINDQQGHIESIVTILKGQSATIEGLVKEVEQLRLEQNNSKWNIR
jgi:hypothetical protein